MEGVEMSTVPAGYFDSNHYLASTRFLLEGRLGNRLEGMERKREREGGRRTRNRPATSDGPSTQALCPLSGLPRHIKGGSR